MDVIRRLRAWALARPRALIVDVPRTDALRWSVEAELDRRGWSSAVSPADTDLLLVLGTPGPEMAAAAELVWSQVPAPRQRVDLRHVDGLGAALDEGRAALLHRAVSGADGDRATPASLLGNDGHADHEGMDHGGGHEGMDHGSGHHMHHGGEVAGLPMAMTAPDRDGLELDVLKTSLGPVLPGWPTGLVLRAELQGDVLTSAELAWLDADHLPDPVPDLDLDPQQAALDRLARFLVVAGWPTAARDARRARDGLGSADPAQVSTARGLAGAVARRVRRSRALAWAAGGVGQAARNRGDGADDSVLDRVRRWCDVAGGEERPELAVPSLDDVAALLDGVEIGTARLMVASLDLRPIRAATPGEPTRA